MQNEHLTLEKGHIENNEGEMDKAMEKLRDGVKAGKDALKQQRFPISEQVAEKKQRSRKKGKSKVGDRRPVR